MRWRLAIRPVKFLAGSLGLLRNVHAIQNIYRLEDSVLSAGCTRQMMRFVKEAPAVAAMIESRYLRGSVPDLDALRPLPPGTLGREYVEHIERFRFNPGYYQTLEPKDDTTYLLARVRETHDIWHVVLGYYPSPLGELGLKAFELAQLRRPLAAMIVAGGVLRYLLINPEQLGDVLEVIATGYEAGRRARPLVAERWEEHWDEPVTQIRQRLNVPALSQRSAGALDPRGVQPSRAGATHTQPAGVALAMGSPGPAFTREPQQAPCPKTSGTAARSQAGR